MNLEARTSITLLVPEVAACGDAAPARLLATALPPDQFRVTVGVLGPANGPEADELREYGIAVQSLPVRNARRFRQAVHETRPAVIHAWGAAAVRAARSLVSRDREYGNAPRLVVSAATEPGRGLGGWLTRRQLRLADRVIPATRADGERYRRLGVPVEQLTLIAPAAPEPVRSPDRAALCRELDIPPRSRLLLTGGRSEAGVGAKDAIVAFDMLRYESKDLYLVVCGAGRETAALEQFGRSLAYDDFRIRFAPCGSHRAAAVGLAEAVLVTTPRGGVEEALEAMAAGKPVLGWQNPDLAEIVADKSTGVLVPLGDRAALAASTRPVLDNAGTARRLGEAGRARATERFGAARMVEQFARLYLELAPVNSVA